MCGIGGIFSNKEIDAKEVKNLILSLENRGNQAVGIVGVDKKNGIIKYVKTPGSPSMLMKIGLVDVIKDITKNSSAVLVHTRQATHGSPDNNANNHPIVGDKYLFLHNGVVRIDDREMNGIKIETETDTEMALRIIEKDGWNGIKKISGTLNFICIDKKNGDVYIYKDNALSIGKTRDKIIIGSTLESVLSVVDKRINDIFIPIHIGQLKEECIYKCSYDRIVQIKKVEKHVHYIVYRPYSDELEDDDIYDVENNRRIFYTHNYLAYRRAAIKPDLEIKRIYIGG